MKECEIKHSDQGPYYEMYIDGKFAGNYDTMREATNELEYIRAQEEEAKERGGAFL